VTTLLVASVGGSTDPIVSALVASRPDVALFVVTAQKGTQPGSAEKVPGILEKAGLSALRHELLVVPADDPESIFLALRETLRDLRRQHPKARLVLDYTGGTKSMSTAMVQCALATPGVEVQFMAGRRDTLDKVTPGTERPTQIPIDWLLAERTEAQLRAYWRDFAYATCAAGAKGLLENLEHDEKAPEAARQRLRDLAAAARAFDAWDRFRHDEAAKALATLLPRHPELARFQKLAERCRDSEPQRIADLWRNAERCAASERYDDAIARAYRLIEWVGQWQLTSRHGIDVGRIDWSRITESEVQRAGLQDRHASRAKTLSGLVQTLKLAAAKDEEGEIARFLRDDFPGKKGKDGEGRLRDMLDLRNRSILAHGQMPLGKADWDRFLAFMEVFRRQVVTPLLRSAGAEPDPPQLPQRPPDTL